MQRIPIAYCISAFQEKEKKVTISAQVLQLQVI